MRTAVDRRGGLHHLVTAAGLLRRQDIAGMTDEQLNDMLSINFLGTFATCRAASRVMPPGSSPIWHRWPLIPGASAARITRRRRARFLPSRNRLPRNLRARSE